MSMLVVFESFHPQSEPLSAVETFGVGHLNRDCQLQSGVSQQLHPKVFATICFWHN